MVAPIEYVLHVDKYLSGFFSEYGWLVYLLLFLIIFAETGLVVAPFLPGDSLIFAAGALSAGAGLNPFLLFLVMASAAILGDSANYWIGYRMGKWAIRSKRLKWLFREEYIGKTREFYSVHGGKTIILARFVPIVRTFAPFLAGIGEMEYGKFFSYNVLGGLFWVGSFLLLGFFFGNLPIVKENFSLAILGIILVSLVPVGLEILKARKK